VRLHGVRYIGAGLYARSRFQCVPADGARAHTFSLAKRSPTHAHPDGVTCLVCEREQGRTDGTSLVPAAAFTLLDAARLLVDVGGGTSLRRASRRLRIESARTHRLEVGESVFSTQNALAADYLDRYGPPVVAAVAPDTWPRIVVLDSVPLNMRIRDLDRARLGLAGDWRGGAVMVGAGAREPGLRARPWIAGLAGGESSRDWWEFLGRLPDEPAPEWVVADGAKAIANAVAARWPNAIFFPCRWHLRERLREAALPVTHADPAIEAAVEVALVSTIHWERLIALAKPYGPTVLWSWITANDPLVRSLDGLRRRMPEAPEGNGAAEAMALVIGDRIGDRKSNFLNARRLETVIGLMCADLAGRARTARYLTVIRAELEAASWRLGAGDTDFWERAHDRGSASSVADLIAASRTGSASAALPTMRASKNRVVTAIAAQADAARIAAGGVAIPATVAPGRQIASRKVAGFWLRDFPELVAQWDPANGKDPQTLAAGTDYQAKWICNVCGHRWSAPVSRRTIRGTRCRNCTRSWSSPDTSLAALYPDLVSIEWARDANLPKRPEAIGPNDNRTAIWHCPDFPGVHPDYPMSPRTRVKRDLGCPICRQLRSAARRRGAPLPS
jgi:hypothetical protein